VFADFFSSASLKPDGHSLWITPRERSRSTCFYPDHIIKYASARRFPKSYSLCFSFLLYSVQALNLGEIMFRYRFKISVICLTAALLAACYDPPEFHPLAEIVLRNVSISKGNPSNILVWNHTVDPGDNRMLLVSVTKRSHGTYLLDSVSYAGLPLIKLSEVQAGPSDYPHAELWYLLSPPVGTATITVTLLSGTDVWQACGMDFTGINQIAPFGMPVTAAGTSGTPHVTVLAAKQNPVIDVLAYYNGTADANTFPGQSLAWANSVDGSWKGAGSIKEGSASVTMEWNVPSGQWAQIAVALQPWH
jgi:hypothetical protein